MKRKKILIIEDESLIALEIRDILVMNGYEVCARGSSGKESISLAKMHNPDLIIMDIFLKGEIDGITAAERIKKDQDIPVMYLTAHSDKKTLERAKRTEPHGYIVKPIIREELLSAIDIALYKHESDKKIKESEEKYRLLINNTRDMIYRMSLPEGKYEFVSPASTEIFGYTPEEFLSTPKLIKDLIHPDMEEYFSKEWQNLVEGNIPKYYEYKIVHRSGKVRWLHQRNLLIRDRKDNPSAIVGSVTDITELKEAENTIRAKNDELKKKIQELEASNEDLSSAIEELEAANEEYERINEELIIAHNSFEESQKREQEYLNVIGVMLIVINWEGKVTLANRKCCEILECSEEEILGSDWFMNFIPETEREKVKKVFDSIMTGRIEAVEYFENYVVSATGKMRLISWHNTLIKDSKGKIIETISSGEDITEKRITERALIESQEKFSKAFYSSPSLMAITKMSDGLIIDANDSFCNTIEYTRDELIGMSTAGLNLWSNPEEREEFVLLIKKDNKAINYEMHLKTRSDKVLTMLLSGEYIILKNEPHLITMAIDITERKNAEEKIRASLKEKEILLKEIHHRVKNNMQVITSLLSLQSARIRDDEARRQFNESEDRIRSMALVHEKLYKSGDLGRVNFREYIDDLISLLDDSMSQTKNINIELKIKEQHLDATKAIPCGLIVTELLSNVSKHAFPDRKSGNVVIYFNMDNEGYYTLSVSDNGTGLPREIELKRIESLGLQLVNALVNQLGGTIEFSSKNGTEFNIVFPNDK